MPDWFKKHGIVLVMVLLACFFALGTFYYASGVIGDVNVADTGSVQKEEKESNNCNNNEDDKDNLYCPLDGIEIEEMPKHRPLAVIMDNRPEARPQSGLLNADLVYEMLVEGGATRFMGVYFHRDASVIGPVRSARPYFIEKALEHKAVTVHCGQSPQAQVFFNERNIKHINEFAHSGVFWRDKNRSAPHNLYSSTSRLISFSERSGWDLQEEVHGFVFSGDEDLSTYDAYPSKEIEIFFPMQFSRVRYTYDTSEKNYDRFMGGVPHKDGKTGLQIEARNIIIQYVETKVIDGQGRLKMKLSGHGRGLVFSGGHVFEAAWNKSGSGQPTVFRSPEGNEIPLLPGQTWIEVVPLNTEVSF